MNAVWIYTMTVATGHFQTLRRGVGAVSDDRRIQALIIGFSFGALLEALTGFGTPVAITVGMDIALGFEPLKAAGVALIGNTAPAAFGGIGTPIITLAGVTGLSKRDLWRDGRTPAPFLALVVPLVIVYIVDGSRGLRRRTSGAVGRRHIRSRTVRHVEPRSLPADRCRRVPRFSGRDRRLLAMAAARTRHVAGSRAKHSLRSRPT